MCFVSCQNESPIRSLSHRTEISYLHESISSVGSLVMKASSESLELVEIDSAHFLLEIIWFLPGILNQSKDKLIYRHSIKVMQVDTLRNLHCLHYMPG